MIAKSKYIIFILFISLAVPGCATTSCVGVLDESGKKVKKFKDLSDEEALKTVVAIYNCVPPSDEDIIAKNIALKEYIGELAKRKSTYLEGSGVFQLTYKDEMLKTWSDQQTAEMYRLLEAKAVRYDKTDIGGLSEQDKALRLIRITAMQVIYREGTKRDIFRNTMLMATNVLMVAMSVAVSIL